MEQQSSSQQQRVLVGRIRDALARRPGGIRSAIDLLGVGMREVERFREMSGQEKRRAVVDALAELAKGADGVEGTEDDVVPPIVVAGVRALLDNDLAGPVINMVVDAAKGRLLLATANGGAAAVRALLCGCFGGGGAAVAPQ